MVKSLALFHVEFGTVVVEVIAYLDDGAIDEWVFDPATGPDEIAEIDAEFTEDQQNALVEAAFDKYIRDLRNFSRD